MNTIVKSKSQKKVVIAHRGASMLRPENTLAAFSKAIELGAQMVELDVRKTADNILVVVHDTAYKGRKIAGLTYLELMELSKNQVPTLQYVLQLAKGKIKLNIELKETGYEKEAVKLIKNYLEVQDFVITSFIRKSVVAVKVIDPKILVGWIVGQTSGLKFWKRWQASKKIDFLSLHKSEVNKFSKLGLPMLAWTIDEDRDLRHFLQREDIFAVVSNRPNVALRINKQVHGQ